MKLIIEPKIDYFIVEGEVIKRGDDRFSELEKKYVKKIDFNEKEEEPNECKDSKESSK